MSVDETGDDKGNEIERNINSQKANILRLLKSDPQFRDEIKQTVRQILRPKFESILNEFVPQINIEDVINKHFPGCKHSTWRYFDDSQGNTTNDIEIKTINKGNTVYLCDIRNVVTPPDVLTLIRVGKQYKMQNPKASLRCVVVTHGVTPKARTMAEKAHIDLIVTSKS
eukprot:TRINITY_DN4938_c0_g1_i2.p1 TRINITY_DN4938_c0_g1~~TRINITY_DN4938_c0_g1_i2.p1  ORF type:complete len:169 (-),score=32.44 TRINITY_DN4938_c0_g1_i2:24-530(-)